MAKWLITSDWQTDFKNLDYCIQAHAQEMRIAEKYKVSGIIDLGDMKDAYDPVGVRVLEFQVKRWKDILDKGYKAIALMGNHDRIGQYADDRNWFSVFRAMGVDAISSSKNLRIIDTENTVFGCLPYTHDKKDLLDKAKRLRKAVRLLDSNKRKILLFHCDIKGADYGLGRNSEMGVNLSTLFSRYWDYSFGGHIHKYQTIGEKAIYVGNPFCCDWGERNQEKGFIVYDDESNRFKRIASDIPNWYSYDYLCENKINDVPNETKIQVTVECKVSGDYYKLLEDKRNEVQARYPKALIYTKPNFIEEETQNTIIDLSFSDKDKIEKYIVATVPKELYSARKKILAYLIASLAKVSSTNLRSRENIRFLSVHAENVLSYKKLDFSYEKLGVVLVVGINKDWPRHSNGSGKTNFLSMLPVALSGQTLKDQKNDSWANEHSKKSAILELHLSDGHKRKFSIIRGRRPTKLQFLIDGKDESTGLRHRGQKETQGVIEDTLGFTLTTLKSSVYIDTSMPKAFIEGTQKDRSELLSRFQNLERFKFARDLVAKDLTKLRASINNTEEEINIETVGVTEHKETLASLMRAHKKSIRSYKRKVQLAKRDYEQIKQEASKYAEVIKAKLKKIEPKLSVVSAKEQETSREIYTVSDELHKQKRELEKMRRILFKICPTCYQKVKASRRERMLGAARKRLAVIQGKFTELHTEHQGYLKDVGEREHRVTSIRGRLEHKLSEINKADDLVAKAVLAYRTYKKINRKSKTHIDSLRQKIKDSEKKITKCHDVIDEERKDEVLLQYCLKAFSRDGIPLFLNNLVCPLLNKVAAEYSQLFTDGEIQLVFKLEDGELQPVIVNSHGSKNIVGQSSGEKAWAGIIAALSLRELAPKTNLLVLDEPGYGLDKESATTLGHKLLLLRDRFESVLVVSHNEAITSILQGDSTITVVKEHKISRISS